MQTESYCYEEIDHQFELMLKTEDIEDRWLLLQTYYMSASRRSIIEALPIQPHARILDIGTGFGALPLELAARSEVHVEGLDIDSEKLEIANRMKRSIEENKEMPGDIHFRTGNAYHLPYDNHSFDCVVAWYVFQHLEKPDQVTEEILRVLRPGGIVCLIDADDQLVLTYPEPSPEQQQLSKAFDSLQRKRGGDRFVGRKLTTFLQRAGFENINPVIQAHAQHSPYSATNANHTMLIEQYLMEKETIINEGLMSEEQFLNCIEALKKSGNDEYRFIANGQCIAMASRPADSFNNSQKI